MKYYRKNLPPLDTLTFFEAAARHLSFTDAAEELLVSQAAVSKRIRQLEDHLGIQLFLRSGRVLELTDAGRRFFQHIQVTLDFLQAAVLDVASSANDAVSIAANTAVSMFWLAPRLRQFALSEQSCPVYLVTTDSTHELNADGIDLRILYGEELLGGFDAIPLIGEELAPVASPGFAKELGASPDLPFLTPEPAQLPVLLNYKRLGPEWINWEVWAERTGAQAIRRCPSKMCRSYAHSLGRAIEGEGIALGSLTLIDEELKSGRLVRIGGTSLKAAGNYNLAIRKGHRMGADVKRLIDFLTNSPG
jgi:LysR family glycine cleavage system transcriptional activator